MRCIKAESWFNADYIRLHVRRDLHGFYDKQHSKQTYSCRLLELLRAGLEACLFYMQPACSKSASKV